MTEETILGLPATIVNSDGISMAIHVGYDIEENVWTIGYSDEGSAIYVEAKTIKKAVEKIRKEHKKVYGTELV